MTDTERLERRLAGVERVLLEDERPFDDIAEVAALDEDVTQFEARLEAHDRRIAEVEGSMQATSGFVDNVRHVNDDVERRANAALAAVDRLERRLDEFETRLEASPPELDQPVEGRVSVSAAPAGERGSGPEERTGVPDSRGAPRSTNASETGDGLSDPSAADRTVAAIFEGDGTDVESTTQADGTVDRGDEYGGGREREDENGNGNGGEQDGNSSSKPSTVLERLAARLP
ncbi:DUF7310 family coiled-coil domain-containing protein [Natronosalvus caseinilyticus]|uniref:DUF7310 family coiled-coil domain-containing protein n=1 Tax=Natronosalvus caseinilyticus TaxID=2953747 RepID=UPI0028ADF9CD|nr:hypothetical protein [Natronosalvus caseinilyticus]